MLLSTEGNRKRGRKPTSNPDKRRAQNKVAQRNFRARKLQYTQDLEEKCDAQERELQRANDLIYRLRHQNLSLRSSLYSKSKPSSMAYSHHLNSSPQHPTMFPHTSESTDSSYALQNFRIPVEDFEGSIPSENWKTGGDSNKSRVDLDMVKALLGVDSLCSNGAVNSVFDQSIIFDQESLFLSSPARTNSDPIVDSPSSTFSSVSDSTPSDLTNTPTKESLDSDCLPDLEFGLNNITSRNLHGIGQGNYTANSGIGVRRGSGFDVDVMKFLT